jgi:TfoX/Sxy family transcriptional regulator of competence genes
MQYYEVPIEVLEDKTALGEWALKALEVARTAKMKKKKKSIKK